MIYDTKTLISLMRSRQKLLMTRDPVANEKIAKKIERRIRALEAKS